MHNSIVGQNTKSPMTMLSVHLWIIQWRKFQNDLQICNSLPWIFWRKIRQRSTWKL